MAQLLDLLSATAWAVRRISTKLPQTQGVSKSARETEVEVWW